MAKQSYAYVNTTDPYINIADPHVDAADLLHLDVIDKKYEGFYYHLIDGNLWYKNPNNNRYMRVNQQRLPTYPGRWLHERIRGLLSAIENGDDIKDSYQYTEYGDVMQEVQKFLKTHSKESNSQHYDTALEGIKNHGFIVAIVEGDAVCFNKKPKVHKTEESAKAEVIRLSAKCPGRHFAYFQAKGVASVSVNWEV